MKLNIRFNIHALVMDILLSLFKTLHCFSFSEIVQMDEDTPANKGTDTKSYFWM